MLHPGFPRFCWSVGRFLDRNSITHVLDRMCPFAAENLTGSIWFHAFQADLDSLGWAAARSEGSRVVPGADGARFVLSKGGECFLGPWSLRSSSESWRTCDCLGHLNWLVCSTCFAGVLLEVLLKLLGCGWFLANHHWYLNQWHPWA